MLHRAWVRCSALGRAGTASALCPETRRQMSRARRFFTDPCRKGKVPWKRTARQGTAQAPGRGLGLAIPEAGGERGTGRRRIGEDRPRQEGQFEEALTRLGGGDKLAGGAEHLLGGRAGLLGGPAGAGEGVQAPGRGGGRGGPQG